jgi:N-acetylglutamate synthase-like GNAT family acetyltransferase
MNEKIKVSNLTGENVDDFIGICIPPDKQEEEEFIRGIEEKRKWALEMLDRGESVAKIGYYEGKVSGMLQYLLDQEEKVIKIRCIFVPKKETQRKGIAKALFRSLLQDIEKIDFEGESPHAIVSYAFEVPGFYSQHLFFEKMGFRRVEKDDPHLLYYPLKENYVYRPRKKSYTPIKEDEGRAVIFYNPSCPWCIYFTELIKRTISETIPEAPCKVFNTFENRDEVLKRGYAPDCIVNAREIKAFVLDRENFIKEIKEAWGK